MRNPTQERTHVNATIALYGLALFFCLLVFPANAQSVCADRVDVVKALKGRPHEEQKQWTGLSAAQTLYEVWSRDGAGWSIIVHLPTGETCIIASGDAWMEPIKESH